MAGLRYRARRRVLAVSPLIMSAVLGAVAAQAEELTAFALSDESLMFGDLPSVFSVSRYEESVADAPASITVVTRDMIRLFGYRNIAEVLGGVPGFYVTNDLNYTYVGFRGFARSGDYNTRMLLLVDGQRLNDVGYDSALLGNEGQIDMDAIERIEITRGPGSSMYGANALLAVINVITRAGKAVDGVESSVSTDSRGLRRVSMQAGTRLGNGVDAFLSLAAAKREGRRHIDFQNSAEFAPPTNWRADYLDDERYDKVFLKLAKEGYSLSAGHASRKKSIPTASFDMEYNAPGASTVDSSEWLSFAMNQRLSESSELRGSLAYHQSTYHGRYVYLDSDSGTLFTNFDDSRSRWWSGDISWLRRGGEHTIVAGLDHTGVFGVSQFNADSSVYLDERHRSNATGIYVQDTWRALSSLQLVAGLRYDVHADSRTRSALSPRLAAVWTPAPSDVVKLMYSSAFRAPNMYEQYYGDGGATQKGNPNLDIERIRTLELAWDHNFSRALKFSGNAYSYSLRNGIVLQQDPNDGLLVFQNVANTRVKGAGGELTWTGDQGSFAQLGANFSQSTSSEAEDPKFAPAWQMFGKVAQPIEALDATIALEWRHLAHRENARREFVAPYHVFNLILSSSEVGRNWRWRAGVYNLFGKRYGDPSGGEVRPVNVPQEGRVFALQLEYAM